MTIASASETVHGPLFSPYLPSDLENFHDQAGFGFGTVSLSFPRGCNIYLWWPEYCGTEDPVALLVHPSIVQINHEMTRNEYA